MDLLELGKDGCDVRPQQGRTHLFFVRNQLNNAIDKFVNQVNYHAAGSPLCLTPCSAAPLQAAAAAARVTPGSLPSLGLSPTGQDPETESRGRSRRRLRAESGRSHCDCGPSSSRSVGPPEPGR